MDRVKCVECGRTLYDGRSTCDVCGGRMTKAAADSYFTPEGQILKQKYYTDNIDRNRNRSLENDEKPKRTKPFSQVQNSLAGKAYESKSTIKGLFNGTTDGKKFKASYIVIAIVAIIVITGSIGLFGEDSYDSGYDDDYDSIYLEEIIEHDQYTIEFYNYFYGAYYTSLTIYILNDSEENIPFNFKENFKGVFDDEEYMPYSLSYNAGSESEYFNEADLQLPNEVILEPGEEAYVSIDWYLEGLDYSSFNFVYKLNEETAHTYTVM